MEFLSTFFQNPINTVIERPLESFIYFLIYLAIYIIVKEQLYSYLDSLHDVLKRTSLVIFDTCKTIFNRATKAFGIGVDNEKPVEFGSEKIIAKSRYLAAFLFTCILIPINIFMLGEFLTASNSMDAAAFGDNEALYFIKIAHIVAIAIVIVETFLGWGYYVAERNAHTFFKWLCIIFFASLWFVETYTWYQLSYMITGDEDSILFNPAAGSAWEGFLDGFLMLTGASLTFFEFVLGYYTAKYREDFGSLHIMAGFARVANYIQSIGFFLASLILFLITGIFYISSYMLVGLKWVIQFIMIIAKFIFEKLGSKKESFDA